MSKFLIILIEEKIKFFKILLQAIFTERLVLTSIFMIMCFPYIVWLATKSRTKRQTDDKEVPFVYVMR